MNSTCNFSRKDFLLSFLTLATFMTISNEAQAGVTETLPSGVKITHTVVGTGVNPKATDKVRVHYRGTLENGKEFDSSYKRNEPITFPLQGVIKAWTEGVQKMKVGGKATLICPPETAYGSRGAGGVIPPNATLTFEIELLAIEK
jgi:FKBP-type peptidyl-prolyl cis-trans isomerase FkpA